MNSLPHAPVLKDEMLTYLAPAKGGVYVDATFGAGGYTEAILDHADCSVIAVDKDSHVKVFAEKLQNKYEDRFIFVHAAFSDLPEILEDLDVDRVDGIVLDIGVSSMQLDEAERGFSFKKEGPLDMRMDKSSSKTAADLVNFMDESDLADIIYKYGEERHSRKIAKAIVKERSTTPIRTTSHLAEIIRHAVPGKDKPGHDKATKSFQALRIAVNDELKELKDLLEASVDLLKAGGRIIVVTFHSLEDRIVKSFFRELSSTKSGVSRHVPEPDNIQEAKFSLLTKKAIKAGPEEISSNTRSRSATLRGAQRLHSGQRRPVFSGGEA